MGGFVAALCWFPGTRPFALFLGLVTATTLVHQLGFAVVGTLAGAVVDEFSLFMGKALAQFNLPIKPLRGSARTRQPGRTVTLSVGSLPFGGSVRFAGMDSEEAITEAAFYKLSLVRRLLIMLSGATFLLLLSAALLGWERAWSAFGSGFGQYVHGALAPLTYGQIMLSRLSDLLTKQPAHLALGVLAAKIAAFNLLPIPTLNGGQALLEIMRPRIKNTDRLLRLNMAGLTVLACLTVSWWVAVAKYVLERPRPAVTAASPSFPRPFAATPAEPQTSEPQFRGFTSNQSESEGVAAPAEAEAETHPDNEARRRLQTEYDLFKAKLDAARPRIEAEERELAQQNDNLAASQQRIRSERRTLDEYNDVAVADFNLTVRAYNRDKDDLLARAEQHRTAVAAFNELVRRLNEKAHALDEMGN